VDDAMVAQQAKFGAITQQLGAAAECTQAAAADLQQQTAELSSQLAVATAATVKALDDTADAAAEGFQVSGIAGHSVLSWCECVSIGFIMSLT